MGKTRNPKAQLTAGRPIARIPLKILTPEMSVFNLAEFSPGEGTTLRPGFRRRQGYGGSLGEGGLYGNVSALMLR